LRLFDFQYEFFAGSAQRAIEPVSLDGIEFSNELVEPWRFLRARR
jgi:hypothetical protein